MFDHRAAQYALRAVAAGIVAAQTTGVALAATSTGYQRSSGSFADDGYVVGMELIAAGFANDTNNGPHLVALVTDTDLVIAGGCTAEAEDVGRTLTVGLPALRAWEGVDFTPSLHRPYLAEAYVPGGGTVRSATASGGMIELLSLYTLQLFVEAATGIDAAATLADATLLAFAPNTDIALPSSDRLTVRSDTVPYRGQLLPMAEGWAMLPVTIPLRGYTLNVTP